VILGVAQAGLEVAVGRRAWARAATALGAWLLLSMTGAAAGVLPPDLGQDPVAEVIAGYQQTIRGLMARERIPGLAVTVVDGDRVVWQQGFGVTDDDGGTAVTTDTMFSVQSTSKTITATAVMRTVQAGLLDLDVPITTYLPDFTVHSAFETHPEHRITTRMLLAHTAGFTHEAPLGNNYEPEPGNFGAHIRSISDTWLRFPVGTGYSYSNLGIDLAGRIMERVWHKPFPVLMQDSLLTPLGMDHSTYDRYRVHGTADRAVGHSFPVSPPVDSPMTAAGGLWTSAADLGRFLRFQLGHGSISGRVVLDGALVDEMRTVPAPTAGAPAGYALGVARTRWPVGRNLDLFRHGGGGNGFLTDLWWLPQLQIGVAVLTNSSDHDIQGSLAEGILRDLTVEPGGPYHQRLVALPAQSEVVDPDDHFVAPAGLQQRIHRLGMPASGEQGARWSRYPDLYRTGQPGAMSPTFPPSRFHVESGVPYFDASEDGTAVPHRLTEVEPGLFLADDGQTLDLSGPVYRWRGLQLNPVTNGPLPCQWVLLAVAAAVAAGWFIVGPVTAVRGRRRTGRWGSGRWGSPRSATDGGATVGRTGRRSTVIAAAVSAVAALASVAAIRAVPGVVDVGFLGRMPFPFPLRLAFFLPLAVVLLAAVLAALLGIGAVRHWWPRRVRRRDAALAVAVTALAVQLASWHLVL
jgi:CubicO group peptidase (beta-lactamase class C family)